MSLFVLPGIASLVSASYDMAPGSSHGNASPFGPAANGKLTLDHPDGTLSIKVGKLVKRHNLYKSGAVKLSFLNNNSGIQIEQDQIIGYTKKGKPRIKKVTTNLIFGKNFFSTNPESLQNKGADWTNFSVPAVQSGQTFDLTATSTEADLGILSATDDQLCDSYTYSEGTSCENQSTTCTDYNDPTTCTTSGDLYEMDCQTDYYQTFQYQYHHYIEHFKLDFNGAVGPETGTHLGTFNGDFINDVYVPDSSTPINSCGDAGVNNSCNNNYVGSC